MNSTRQSRAQQDRRLQRSYARALRDYLAGNGEEGLQKAYEIGREALAAGCGVMQVAAMYHAALAGCLKRARQPAAQGRVLARAKEFLNESLSSHEMAHRGFRDAVSALRQVNETLEQEIHRIAHAVHDEAGQLLVAARLAIFGVAPTLPDGDRMRLQEVSSMLDEVEKQLRRLSHELRPTILDDLGLLPAVRFLADSIGRRSGLNIQVESSVQNRYAMKVETALYRVIQEALTNVTKHAKARNVEIRLDCGKERLQCLVHDDGVGFDAGLAGSRRAQRGLGLVGIRERLNAVGGTLRIISQQGQGTDLVVSVPVEH